MPRELKKSQRRKPKGNNKDNDDVGEKNHSKSKHEDDSHNDKSNTITRSRRKKKWKEDELEVVIVDSESDTDESSHEIITGNNKKKRKNESSINSDCPLLSLPDHIMLKIISNLDDKDVFNLASTSKAFDSIIWQGEVWENRITKLRYLPPDKINIPFFPKLNKNDIIDMYNKNEEQRRLSNLRAKQLKEENNRHARLRCGKVFLKYLFFNRAADYLVLFSIMLATWLIIYKLDEKIDAPWRVILIPFAIPLALLNGGLVLYDCLRWRYYDIIERPGIKTSFVRILFIYRKRRIYTYTVISCLNLTYIFTMIKMNEQLDGIHSAAIFVPLMIICLATIILVIGFRGGDFKGFDAFTVTCANIFIIIQLIFVMLRIENTILWKWAYVFIPLWILSGLVVVFPIISAIFSCCCFCIEDSIMFKSGYGFTIVLFSVWFLILIPGLAYFGMVTMMLDNKGPNRSWLLISAPVIFMQCYTFLLCLYGDYYTLTY